MRKIPLSYHFLWITEGRGEKNANVGKTTPFLPPIKMAMVSLYL
jgi:hypothetical protein